MRAIIIIIFILLHYSAKSQNIEEFKTDLEELYNLNFPTKKNQELMKNHYDLLFWLPDAENVQKKRRANIDIEFPLSVIVQDEIYKKSIHSLMLDTGETKTELACLLILATNDTSNIQYIKSLIKSKNIKYKGALYVHAFLEPRELDFILDNIINIKDPFLQYYMYQSFFYLDYALLEDFAYKNFYDSDPTIQYLATQSLKYSTLTLKKKQLIQESITKLPIEKKAIGLELITYFKLAHISNLVSPYLQIKSDTLNLEYDIIKALIASPSNKDHRFLYNHLKAKDSLDRGITILLNSPIEEHIKNGLTLLSQKPIKNNTYFNIENNESLFKDKYLDDIHLILKTNQNEDVITALIRLLYHRYDQKSTELLIYFLSHDSYSIARRAARALVQNPSLEIKNEIIFFATNSDSPNLDLVDYLIHNHIDTLQDFYYNIYINKDSVYAVYDCEQAFKYLATFPKDEYKQVFIDILKEYNHQEYLMNREASAALGKLKIVETIALIEEHLNIERKVSDSNCTLYINALANIKTKKSFEIISSFKNSEDTYIIDLVNKILKNW